MTTRPRGFLGTCYVIIGNHMGGLEYPNESSILPSNMNDSLTPTSCEPASVPHDRLERSVVVILLR